MTIPAWIGALSTIVLLSVMVVQIVRVEVKQRRSKRELDACVQNLRDSHPPRRISER